MRKPVRLILGFLAACAVVAAVPLYSDSSQFTDEDFFSAEELQEIHLSLNSRDWRALKENYQSNAYYPAELRWRGVVVRGVGIRSRGRGSRNQFKPGIKIDVNHYLPEQTFLGLKAIVVDNLSQDASMLRERLSMRFFQRMGVAAPRVTHARLFVNNQYAGLYGITEAIDQRFLARVFGSDDHGGVENDGYLYEYRWLDVEPWFRLGYLGSDLDAYAARFAPRTHERHDPETLYRPLEQMFKAVDESTSDDFEQRVSEFVDLPSLIRQVAVESFIADWDGLLGAWGPNNFYFYRFENRSHGRFIPWDKDVTFFDPYLSVMNRVEVNRIFHEAIRVRRLYDTYLDALNEAADSAETPQFAEGEEPIGWLEREIRQAFDQIRDAALADVNKPFANDEFLLEVDKLLEFARIRGGIVREEVSRIR